MMTLGRFFILLSPSLFSVGAIPADAQQPIPTSSDPAVALTKFAGSNLIKHPTGITFTKEGKLLAVESHTHFKPKNYTGNDTDQIWWIEDSDGDGKADKRTLFFEADLVATMDIATHPESGAIYVATRNEILRLWDINGDGKADPESIERRLVFLDSEGKYPHDGCSGLTFDPAGDLFFGVGENLGFAYTLKDSDGTNVSDEGEGGNIWHCDRDGKNLRRFATGFWNPFGVVCSPKGHVFATDNDPSSRPPSRLHYVIDGGDYGYQFRYGRSGHHPFVSWNGELTGTLPMLHGSGEAPCDVIFHEGHLLVASWADHRIERYPLTWDRTHFTTEQKILVQGGVDFRPVAFAKANDGSIFVSDWVKRDYELHGEGAIWRMAGWEPKGREMPEETNIKGDLNSEDAWLVSRAITDFAKEIKETPELHKTKPADNFAAWALSFRKAMPDDSLDIVPRMLSHDDETVQLLALKWIADNKLEKFLREAQQITKDPTSPILFHAAITAVARLNDRPVDDKSLQRIISKELSDKEASPTAKQAAFYIVADRENFLGIKELKDLFSGADDDFKIEVLLTLLVHPEAMRAGNFAAGVMKDDAESERVKFFAMDVAKRSAEAAPAVLNYSATDADIGRRAFHHSCAMCHRALGFGKLGGPDLSNIGQRGREHIEKSIIDPSSEIAPQFEPWKLSLDDGTEKIGFLLRQKGRNHFYSNIAGNEFKIDNRTIVTREQLPISLMPPGLSNAMSEREFDALVSWLASLK